jgi:NAD(P)-dependent dehydrogenase (short-subunit alcohol dehydrogenase family)
VTIGSVVGSKGNAGQCAYSMSKAGLWGLTTSLAKELGPKNIRVNLVEPGFISTDMTKNTMSHGSHEKVLPQIGIM